VISRCTLICVGKPKGWSAEGSADYASRLRRYFHIDVIEVPEEDINRRTGKEVLSRESQRILKSIPTESHVISLDRERGKQQPSEKIARILEDLGVSGRSHVTFIIGGPLGLSQDVLQRSHELWSLGEITLPHALARVVLLEQLYRAAKIHRNKKYNW
jgi:23S rRNA (pseudouridine1915-N3)-methyltransferase